MKALALAGLLGALALPVQAGDVDVEIDISDQAMTVSIDRLAHFIWPVSTARAGKCTPVGTYGVQAMKRMHYSTLYNNAPMPWSIFFYGNYAIHGTTQVDQLGQPASAGCVRLDPENAETLYRLVLEHGRFNTVIHITE